MEERQIGRPCLLLVEGRDEEEFFGALADHLGIGNLQPWRLPGKDGLPDKVQSVRKQYGFYGVKSLGIVLDADASAENTFQSVCGALRKAGLSVPNRMGESAGTDPMISVFIMPDNKSEGMLEDLCLRAVADDGAMPCVEDFILCVKKRKGDESPKSMSKATIRAFLASRHILDLALGHAAGKGYLPWDSPAFKDIISFMKQVTTTS